MPSRRIVIVVGLASLLAGCSPGGPGPSPGGAVSPAQLTRAAILDAINGVRKANGRAPLAWNGQLATAARSQAELMAQKDQMSHTMGGSLRARVTAAGYEGAVGENLAAGQKTLGQAIEGWLASPGHRSTLLSAKFTEFGLAAASVSADRRSRYGTYWTFIAGGPFAAWM
jgi:uncharacterized protein YkwD